MKKLKAFTLMELIVGMAISCMLMGICFIAYKIVLNQFNSFSHNSSFLSEVSFCNYLLNKDFESAVAIEQPSDYAIDIELSETSQIHYVFEPDYVLRIQGDNADTIHVSTKDMKISYMDSSQKSIPHSKIEGLTFSIFKGKEQFDLSFQKEYSPHYIVNTKERFGNQD